MVDCFGGFVRDPATSSADGNKFFRSHFGSSVRANTLVSCAMFAPFSGLWAAEPQETEEAPQKEAKGAETEERETETPQKETEERETEERETETPQKETEERETETPQTELMRPRRSRSRATWRCKSWRH